MARTVLYRLVAYLRVHNVGILFDPARNERRAAEDAAVLKRARFSPVVAPATGPTALPNALTRLANSVDVLQCHSGHDRVRARAFARLAARFDPRPRSAHRSVGSPDARRDVGSRVARSRLRVRMSAAGGAKVLRARRCAIERGRHAGLRKVVRCKEAA